MTTPLNLRNGTLPPPVPAPRPAMSIYWTSQPAGATGASAAAPPQTGITLLPPGTGRWPLQLISMLEMVRRLEEEVIGVILQRKLNVMDRASL